MMIDDDGSKDNKIELVSDSGSATQSSLCKLNSQKFDRGYLTRLVTASKPTSHTLKKCRLSIRPSVRLTGYWVIKY